MIVRFFRAFFWAILVGSLAGWAYLSWVTAGAQEAIIVKDSFHGVDQRVIGPRQSRFLAARAFPGRVELHRVQLGPRPMNIAFRAPLKQGVVLGLDDTFDIRIEISLMFRLQEGRLTNLFQLAGQDWRGLPAYQQRRITGFIKDRIQTIYVRDAELPTLEGRLRTYVRGPFRAELNAELAADGIRIDSIIARTVFVPNAASYEAMKARRREVVDEKIAGSRMIIRARAHRTASRLKDRAYFERLEKLGLLLRRHPHLREYLAIDRLSGKVRVLVMPSDRFFGRSAGARSVLAPFVDKQTRRPPPVRPQPGAPIRRTPPTKKGEFIDRTPP